MGRLTVEALKKLFFFFFLPKLKALLLAFNVVLDMRVSTLKFNPPFNVLVRPHVSTQHVECNFKLNCQAKLPRR